MPLLHPARMSLEDLLEIPSAKWLFLRLSRRLVEGVSEELYGWLGSNTGCWTSSSRRRGYHACAGQTRATTIRDLFATRLNHQLPLYVSWQPDPFAMATDAFQVRWTNLEGLCLSSLFPGRQVPTESETGAKYYLALT